MAMNTKQIHEFVEAGSILDTDSVAASVGNKTRQVSIALLRATLVGQALETLAGKPKEGPDLPNIAADYIGQSYVRTTAPYGLFIAVAIDPDTIWVEL